MCDEYEDPYVETGCKKHMVWCKLFGFANKVCAQNLVTQAVERLASSAQWVGDGEGTKKAFDFAYNSGYEYL